MTTWQRWKPFAVLCGLVALSVVVGALLPRYRQLTHYVSIAFTANAIVYAFVTAYPKEP